jgi:hypothetical protein
MLGHRGGRQHSRREGCSAAKDAWAEEASRALLARDAGIQSAFTQTRVVKVLHHHRNPGALELAKLAFTAFIVFGAVVPNLL